MSATEIDRDTDGELLIDWSPGKGRMITLSLRDDGRLSYAFMWDGEKAHGTAQMPALQQQLEPVAEVRIEPDYWSRGHFYEGNRKQLFATGDIEVLPVGTKLYTTPPDLLQMLHECAEYIAALNGEQDDYCQRARALIARATGEAK